MASLATSYFLDFLAVDFCPDEPNTLELENAVSNAGKLCKLFTGHIEDKSLKCSLGEQVVVIHRLAGVNNYLHKKGTKLPSNRHWACVNPFL